MKSQFPTPNRFPPSRPPGGDRRGRLPWDLGFGIWAFPTAEPKALSLSYIHAFVGAVARSSTFLRSRSHQRSLEPAISLAFSLR